MSKLHQRGNDRYAFDSAEVLKVFLSIDGKCLGNARNKARCPIDLDKKKPLSKKSTMEKIKEELEKVNEAGFPSDDAAVGLRKLARKCMCSKHPVVMTGYGPGAVARSQEEDMYAEWNRRLWVEFLKANGVHFVYGDVAPPDVGDGVGWRRQFALLKLGEPPEAKRDDNLGESVNRRAESSLEAGRTGSPPAGTLKRGDTIKERIGASIGRIMKPFSRPAAPAQRAPQNQYGLRRAQTTAGGFAESPRREHPVQRAPKNEDDGKSVHAAVGGSAETDRREYPELREPENENDEKSSVVDAPAPVEDNLESPEKRRGSPGGDKNDIQRLLDTGADASPGGSFLSIAPSATFSVGESTLGRTPDTLYSHYDPMSTAGKGTSSCEGRTDQNDVTVANPAPASHTEGTQPPFPDPSDLFNPTRKSTGRRPGPYLLHSRMDTLPPSESLTLESSPGSERVPRNNAVHELDTPTKPRPLPVVEVPSSPDSKEEQSEEGQPGTSNGNADFELYWGEHVDKYKVLEKLLKNLEQIKNRDQMKGGYIYVLSRESASGFVKIGRSVEPYTRKKTLERECNYKFDFFEKWHMAVAHETIESCIHCHLAEDRYWDNYCKRKFDDNEGKVVPEGGADPEVKGKILCWERHKEWFKVPKSRAEDVIKLWQDFIKTEPFPNGTLDEFWRKEMLLVRNEMDTWKKNGHPPLDRWDEVMRAALRRRATVSVGNPMADIQLRLRVRSEAETSVAELLGGEGSSDVPLVSIPMLTSQRGEKPEALHTQTAPPLDT